MEVIELPEVKNVAPKKPKTGKKAKKEDLAPIDQRAVEAKAQLDHKFVKVNKDGTTTRISEEEGQAAKQGTGIDYEWKALGPFEGGRKSHYW